MQPSRRISAETGVGDAPGRGTFPQAGWNASVRGAFDDRAVALSWQRSTANKIHPGGRDDPRRGRNSRGAEESPRSVKDTARREFRFRPLRPGSILAGLVPGSSNRFVESRGPQRIYELRFAAESQSVKTLREGYFGY